jgi:N-acetylmuramic acid 6-phosphate etherase
MVDLRATNEKLKDRSERIVMEIASLDRDAARAVLKQADGQVKLAIVMALRGVMRDEAERLLEEHGGVVRKVLNQAPPPVASE